MFHFFIAENAPTIKWNNQINIVQIKFSPKCALRVKMFNFDAVKCLKMVKIAHMWMAVFYQIRWIKNVDQLVRGKHVFLGIWKFITPKFVSVFPFIISNRPTFSEGRGVQTSLGIQICPSPPPYVFLNTPKFADILRFFFIQKKWKLCFWKKVTTHWFIKIKVLLLKINAINPTLAVIVFFWNQRIFHISISVCVHWRLTRSITSVVSDPCLRTEFSAAN